MLKEANCQSFFHCKDYIRVCVHCLLLSIRANKARMHQLSQSGKMVIDYSYAIEHKIRVIRYVDRKWYIDPPIEDIMTHWKLWVLAKNLVFILDQDPIDYQWKNPLFFSIIRYYFSIFQLWLARRLQLTRSHVLLGFYQDDLQGYDETRTTFHHAPFRQATVLPFFHRRQPSLLSPLSSLTGANCP